MKVKVRLEWEYDADDGGCDPEVLSPAQVCERERAMFSEDEEDYVFDRLAEADFKTVVVTPV